MLPPDSTATTGPVPYSSGSLSRAATGLHPAGLDDELGPLQAQQQGAGERVLRHRADLVKQFADDAEGDVAGAADLDAVGHRDRVVDRHRVGRP